MHTLTEWILLDQVVTLWAINVIFSYLWDLWGSTQSKETPENTSTSPMQVCWQDAPVHHRSSNQVEPIRPTSQCE